MGELVTRTARHLCPLCEAGCGLEVTITDEEVTLIRGDRNDVLSGGFLCPKGTALKALQADPDRLRRPLIKRNGAFVEVDFDEAFAEIENRIGPIRAEYGPASSGLVIGNPTVHRTGLVLYALDLAAALGSPNVFSSASLDQMPKHLAVGRMYGDFYSIPVPDIERTDLLVIIGANPMVSNGSMWSVPDFRGRAKSLKARGGRIITIDPRFTETSKIADQHIHVRPDTDVYLLAAIVHTLFEEALVDIGRLAPLVADVGAVRTAVQTCSPERVATRCGIDARIIRTLARELAAAPTAALYGRLGTCLQRYATATSWLIEVVNTLTGNLDNPGGSMFAKAPAFAGNTSGASGTGAGVTTGAYHSRVSGAPEVMNQFPLACLAEEIDTPGDGQIRSLIMIASNATLSAPDGPRLTKALEQIDFLVCLDIYVNETTRHADVILPGPSALEEAHYDVFFSQFAHRNVARYSTPALQPAAGMSEDWETMVRLIGILNGRGAQMDIEKFDDELTRSMLAGQPEEEIAAIMSAFGERVGSDRRIDLAVRSGPYGDLFGLRPDGLSLDGIIAAPSGIDLGPLQTRIPEVLRTPSGKVELAPQDIVESLTAAVDELDDPIAESVLIGRRHLRSNNSWMHNLPVLAKGRTKCTLLVHPNDAAEWELVDGEMATVRASSTAAEIVVTVEIDEAMMRGVVSLPHGWGHDQPETQLGVARQRPGVSVNVLTDATRRDQLSGNAALNGIAITVRPRVE